MKRTIFAILFAAAPLCADVIHLRGGGKLTGQILLENGETVSIDIGAGMMTVPASNVVNIERTTSPLQEYRERAATVAPNDIDSWRKLARWATEHGLSQQAHEAYSKVQAAYPDDAEATRALGLVFYEGRWITEEESYKKRGYVKYGGEWMTKGEKQAILQEEHNRKAENRAAVASLVKESEAARKEREAEEARWDEEEKRRHELPTLGDSMFYGGYGYAPATWSTMPGGTP